MESVSKPKKRILKLIVTMPFHKYNEELSLVDLQSRRAKFVTLETRLLHYHISQIIRKGLIIKDVFRELELQFTSLRSEVSATNSLLHSANEKRERSRYGKNNNMKAKSIPFPPQMYVSPRFHSHRRCVEKVTE